MNVDTSAMSQYAEFLESHSQAIVSLCNQLEECLLIAVQCMDQQSGHAAAYRMGQNLENIKRNVPMADDAGKRLILSLKHINSATQVFGR